MTAAARGAVASEALVRKRYSELYLALELVALGQDGVGALSQNLLYPSARAAAPVRRVSAAASSVC
jgi:hypothetical protein